MLGPDGKDMVRLIAFYLPQFHPTHENDRWWGKGFTEWRNVATSRPLFRGHYQPHIPADLGFYDLRLPEVREAQADLAREYGISGFCYYHYRFGGKRLLERPFEEVLRSGQPDFPFCLCWANESWTRAWDGRSGDVLIEEEYSEEDDRQHIQWLLDVFGDRRYIRVESKPIFLIYRANRLPNPIRTTSIWREEARKQGIGEIFLCRVESFHDEHTDPKGIGFDAAIEFQPDWMCLGLPLRRGIMWRLSQELRLSKNAYRDHDIFAYEEVIKRMVQKPTPPYRRFPCVTPSWDNSARRNKGAVILKGSNPMLYEKWLKAVVEREISSHSGDHVVFINAWNEWAEGNHLEPDLHFGHGYLEAIKRTVQG
jgi:lipopolysaccharide biosynthesis protein